MKKLSFVAVILTFCFVSASSQPCPDSLYIISQAQIDSFQINYPGCTEIEGDVWIFGNYINISNLNGLSVLTYIGGDVFIGYTVLTNLTGLNNVDSIGGDFTVYVNNSLTSLTGMDNLTAIGGGLEIESHDVLTSLSGLENVTSVRGDLTVSDNDALINIEGLGNVISFGGDLVIMDNISLTNLSGLNNVTSIVGSLVIMFNHALTSLTGLDNLTSIEGEEFGIIGNSNLTSLTGLDNVTSIDGDFRISVNTALTSLSSLDNLTSIGGIFVIYHNTALSSLTGLDYIDASSIDDLIIIENDLLFTCEVQSICDYLVAPGGTIEIHDNATGCNSQEEVEEACGLSVEEQYINGYLLLFPNPAKQELNISIDGLDIDEVSIYTLTGQQVLHVRPVNSIIDISALEPGMYIVEVVIENTRLRQKLLVQR